MDAERQKLLDLHNEAQEARRAGNLPAAVTHLRECLVLAKQLSDGLSQGRLYAMLGDIQLEAGASAEALACFELAANILAGAELRHERLMMLFRLAQAAHETRNEARAIEAYDEIIRLAQGSADIRAEGLARALRAELVCERGSYREGLEQMLLGMQRLRTAKAPETDAVISRAAHYGSHLPRKEYERMIKDLAVGRDIRHRLLGE
jgi:tetratricopeptide (TPR) repeat protein